MNKKIIFYIFYIFMFSSFSFADEYDNLLNKAKNYESQKNYVYAMGTYYDAIFSTDDFNKEKVAYEKFSSYIDAFSNGEPGFDQYDEFSIYDAWLKTVDDFLLYWTENNPWIVKFDKLNKGELNYENRTTNYSIEANLVTTEKYVKMYTAIRNGFLKKAQSNWHYNAPGQPFFRSWTTADKLRFMPPVISEYWDDRSKNNAKKKIPLFFYQEGNHTNNSGLGYFTRIFISKQTSTYSTRVGTQGVSVTVNDGEEYVSCLTLNFRIVDNDGTILLEGNDVPLYFYCTNPKSTGSLHYQPNVFKYTFNNVSADLMRKIDAKTYTIEPVSIKVKYGYLPEKISADLHEIEILPVKEFPISIDDVEISKVSEKIKNQKTTLDAFELSNDKTVIKKLKDQNLTSIMIPDGIIEIYDDAFNNTNITEITFPESLTKIGKSAFANCKKLTKISLPNSLSNLGENAFYGCTNLNKIIFSENILEIKDYTFSKCENLISITLPKKITKIGNHSFDNCKKLTDIKLPYTVTEIGESAFYRCESILSITIPKGVKTIKNSAFQECRKLRIIQLPDTVTEIGRQAFSGCYNLTSINIPNGISEISDELFCQCCQIQSIEIPNTVRKIGDKAFFDCSELQSIQLPKGILEIKCMAFYKCSSLKSIDIPNSVTKIGKDAFYNCSSLKTLTIPESVTEIEIIDFDGCTSLVEVKIPKKLYKTLSKETKAKYKQILKTY